MHINELPPLSEETLLHNDSPFAIAVVHVFNMMMYNTCHVISPQLTVQCHVKKTAPCVMMRGSATTDHHFSYFSPLGSTSAYSYEWSVDKWDQLRPCPHRNSALVIIDGGLTAVGGVKGSRYTNKLFTLQRRGWAKKYPPMNTARSCTAVVSTSDGDNVMVIGGYGGGDWITKVELFQVRSRRWYELTNLPRPLSLPSATICGSQLHVIGYNGDGYSCSLEGLPSSDQPITSQSISRIITWTPLLRLPVNDSTAATLCGQLVIIGGRLGILSIVNSIYQLVDGQWVEIGSMSSDRCTRWSCFVVSPSPDKMMIVGGVRDLLDPVIVNIVEECVVV